MSNSVEKIVANEKFVAKLADILTKNDLAELEYETEDCRISLVKSRAPVVGAAPMMHHMPMQAPQAAPAPAANTPATPAPAPVVENTDLSKHPGAVKSPMVGVIYLASDPGSPNYVKIGDSVKVGDTVCLIEAMKTFNPVKSTVAGKVTKILVESGDPVEYGEPLVIIE